MNLYILKLEHDCWYVGTTSRTVEERFAEHVSGRGSQWTKLHKPLRIHDFRPVHALQSGVSLETRETFNLMLIHGINKVRGGPKIQVEDFSLEQKESLVTDIGHTLEMKFDDVRTRLGLPERKTATKIETATILPLPLIPTALFSQQKIHHQETRGTKRSTTKTTTTARTTTTTTPKRNKRVNVKEFSICANCGDDKTDEQDRPLCRSCWKGRDPTICATCSDDIDGDPDKPICINCYREWKKTKGKEALG